MTHTRADAFVFFGATGDLAFKQIFPALQSMIRHGHLDVPVIGVAFSGWSLERFRERARESLAAHGGVDEAAFTKLLALMRYVDGDYASDATFTALKKELQGAARPLHYLAIPPSLFGMVVEKVGRTGCAEGGRVVVEKPFGRDVESARVLNQTLHAVFEETAIFRIDHYLGKEAVQNLVVLRFANTILEPVWNRHYVKSVQITMAESFGVQGRGKFYDETGAIRDVVQNHMLQVVGLLAMEPPASTYHEAMRDEMVKVLREIPPLDPRNVVRGQCAGYTEEAGVAKSSQMETFAALRLEVDSWRWAGVPFFIRVGKSMPVTATEVVVEWQRPPITGLTTDRHNYLRLRLGPDMRIAMGLRVKKPGDAMVGEPSELGLAHHATADEMPPYERLLGDAMAGDPSLFAREDAVEAAWKIVAPILGNVVPLHAYTAGTWGPSQSDALTREVGGWDNPE